MAFKLQRRASIFVIGLLVGLGAWGQPRVAEAAPPKPGDVLVLSGAYVYDVDPATRAQTLILDLTTITDPDIFVQPTPTNPGGPLPATGVAESRDGIIWVAYRNSLHPYAGPTGVPCSGNCGGVLLRVNPDMSHSIVPLGWDLFPEVIVPALDTSVLVTTGGHNPGGLLRIQATDATTTSVQHFAIPETLSDPGCLTPTFVGYQAEDPVFHDPLFSNTGQPVIAVDANGQQLFDAQGQPIPEYFDPWTLQPIAVYTDPAGLACDFDVTTFKEPRGIAVDPTTGNIFIGDIEGGLVTSGSTTVPFCVEFGDCGGLYDLAPGSVIGAQRTLRSDFNNASQGPLGEDAGSAVALRGNQFVVTDGFWWVAHDLENSPSDPCVGATRPASCTVLGGVFLVNQNGARTLLSAYGSPQGQTGAAIRQALPMVVTFDGSILIAGCDRVSGVSTSDSICQVAGPTDANPGFRTLWSDFGAPLFGVAAMSVVPTQLAKTPTSTSVVPSPNPSAYGQSVTFSATVTGNGGTPSGQVTFLDGAVPLAPAATLGAGTASISTATLAVGSHTITASYDGDSTFDKSVSPPATLVVNQAQTMTSLSVNLAVSTFGDSLQLTAVVAPQFSGVPGGAVNFFDGATLIGSKTLDGAGEALVTVATLGVGAHTLTATYLGDTNFTGSSGTASETINPVGSTVVVVAAPQPADVGSPVTLTANVSLLFGPTPPTGTVTFTIDGTDTTPVAVAGKSASYVATGLSVGAHTVVATYVPDTPNIVGSKSAPIDVIVRQIATSTVLVASPNPAASGQVVTLTATVSATRMPVGTVTFEDNGVPIGPPIPLPAGSTQVQLQVPSFGVGTHPLTALFVGDPTIFANSSGFTVLKVNPALTSTTLTVTPATSISGQIVTMVTSVSSPGSPSVTGTVTFAADGFDLATMPLVSNQATYSNEFLGSGTHSVTARYNASGSFAQSISAPVSATVDFAVTSPSRSASPNPKMDYYGGPVISNVEVRAVFWGNGVDPTVQGQIGGFFTHILASSFTDLLREYSTVGRVATAGLNIGQPGSNQLIGRGTYAGSTTIVPSVCNAPPCLIYNNQIQDELNRQIALGALASPTYDAAAHPNTVYMVYFPPGVTIDAGTPASPGGTSCSVFLGYHSTGTLPGGQDLVYGVIADQSACDAAPFRQSTGFESVTQVSSHELSEAITDPSVGKAAAAHPFGAPIGWYSEQQSVIPYYYTTDYGEIADVCNLIVGTVSGYTAQLIWSNQQNACVLATASAPVLQSIAVTPANPSINVGSTQQLTATGTFSDGSTQDLTASVTWASSAPAVATITTGGLATGATVGTSMIRATSGAISGSTTLTVTRASTLIVLSSSANPSSAGQMITITATVSGYAPSGTVTFAVDGGTPIGPVTLQAGSATTSLSGLAAGTHIIVATYSGDSNNQQSTSTPLTQVVTAANGKTPTTTTLTSSGSPSRVGQAVTFTATVSGVSPTGVVTFSDQQGTLGTAPVINGVATFTTSSMGKGAHQVTAAYGGDGGNLPSTSPKLKQQVQ